MTIIIKNKETLIYDDFKFRCSVGKKGFARNKIEGDYKTPIGIFNIGNLYYRNGKLKKPNTKIKCIKIKKNMGWCDDPKSRHYNQLIYISKKKIKCEKLYRKDHKYDILIELDYNRKKIIPRKGSAIFLHLTNNYKPTAGCIAISENDMKILIKILDKKNYIKVD